MQITCRKYHVLSMPLHTCVLRQNDLITAGNHTGKRAAFSECCPAKCEQAAEHMEIFRKTGGEIPKSPRVRRNYISMKKKSKEKTEKTAISEPAPADAAAVRTCKYCGVSYPLAEGFFVNKGGKDGYESRCKKCKASRAKETRRIRRGKVSPRQTETGAVVTVNFAGRGDAWKRLREMSEQEIRTPADQLLWLFMRDYMPGEPADEVA